jgi:hypothetical protein
LLFPAENLQQGRFPGAVAPENTDPLTRFNLQGNIHQQRPAAETVGNMLEGPYRHSHFSVEGFQLPDVTTGRLLAGTKAHAEMTPQVLRTLSQNNDGYLKGLGLSNPLPHLAPNNTIPGDDASEDRQQQRCGKGEPGLERLQGTCRPQGMNRASTSEPIPPPEEPPCRHPAEKRARRAATGALISRYGHEDRSIGGGGTGPFLTVNGAADNGFNGCGRYNSPEIDVIDFGKFVSIVKQNHGIQQRRVDMGLQKSGGNHVKGGLAAGRSLEKTLLSLFQGVDHVDNGQTVFTMGHRESVHGHNLKGYGGFFIAAAKIAADEMGAQGFQGLCRRHVRCQGKWTGIGKIVLGVRLKNTGRDRTDAIDGRRCLGRFRASAQQYTGPDQAAQHSGCGTP